LTANFSKVTGVMMGFACDFRKSANQLAIVFRKVGGQSPATLENLWAVSL
jgi:hypothetical protein